MSHQDHRQAHAPRAAQSTKDQSLNFDRLLHVHTESHDTAYADIQASTVSAENMQKLNLETAIVLTTDTQTSAEASSDADDARASDSADVRQNAVPSGSAVHILNKMIEVVEDEENHSANEADAATDDESTSGDAGAGDGDVATDVAQELTISEPEAIFRAADDTDASNDDAYPELSAEDQERYNKMLLKEGDVCPACGKGTLILRQNERVAFLGCSCFPQCKLRYYTARTNAVKNLKTLQSTCPECGAKLAVKKGRYGLFIGCSDYPQCTYTYKEDNVDEEISCPSCNKGNLERRRARSGRIFFGCNSYPACEFIVPSVPVANPCKECGFPIRYKKKVKAGIALICANPLCASRRRRKQELIGS